MANNNKKYHCRFCSFSSDRKYNRDIHEDRIHKPNNNNQNNNKSGQFTNLEQSSPHWINLTIQPSPSSFPFSSFPAPPFPVNLNSDEVNDKIKREKERNFNKTMLKYFQKVVLPSSSSRNSQLNNSQSNYVISAPDILRNIDHSKLPKGCKIFKCNKCLKPIFDSLFDFQNMNSIKECPNCFNPQQSNDNLTSIWTDCQQLLLSIIYSRLESEKILLVMKVLPNEFIENALLPSLLIIAMIKGNYDFHSIIPIFHFLEIMKLFGNERFFDLGEINPSHWAKRAYDSEIISHLDKKELQQFITVTKGTFGLIKFKIDGKTIYTFSFIPFI
jgi:hypothetical protein